MKFIQFKRMILNLKEFRRVVLTKESIYFVFYEGEYSVVSSEKECSDIFNCFAEFLHGNNLYPLYKGNDDVFDLEYVLICLSDKNK